MAGLRGLDGDLGRLEVADFADHDDVRVLAQEGAQRRGEGEAHLRVDVDLVDAGQADFDRVFAVEMLVSSLFRMLRPVYSETVLPLPVGPVTRIMPCGFARYFRYSSFWNGS